MEIRKVPAAAGAEWLLEAFRLLKKSPLGFGLLAVIYAVLFLGGCLRSIQFTSLNSIAYADLTAAQMSKATSLASAAQQISLGLGVTLGATALAVSMRLNGSDTLAAGDFPWAFLLVTLCASLSIPVFRRLPLNAGEGMAGPVRRQDG